MKQQWYVSKTVKGLLILLAHVTAVMSVVSLLWAMTYPSMVSEVFSGSGATEYEDTDIFKNRMIELNCEVMRGLQVKELFETDGVYDPQKIIDIQEYMKSFGQELRLSLIHI